MAEDRDQEIRERAYRIWQDEGEPSGRDQDHWSRAEAELGDAPSAGDRDDLIPDSADDLPFGEPEDTGPADAARTEGSPDPAEVPQTSGIVAASGQPAAPAAKARKGKGTAKVSN